MNYGHITGLVIAAAIFVILLSALIALSIFKRKSKDKKGKLHDIIAKIRNPIIFLLVVTVIYEGYHIYLLYYKFNFSFPLASVVNYIYTIIVLFFLGWLGIQAINLISYLLLKKYDLSKKDNYKARKMHTRVHVIKSLASVCIVFLMIFIFLMSFEAIRAKGVSLLASAGVVSIILGFAAQKTLGNLFTGIQIAIAQPIRVDDVVVVENEWGRIEEINLSYVVVKIWDLRRLVVPISYFTDHSFQNWTRKSSDLIGSIMLYVDYTMPVQAIREELDRLLEGNVLWDGKVKVVQVTDTKDKMMEVRILLSAADSGAVWDLRCAIREGLITFIQSKHTKHLPQFRTEISQLHKPSKRTAIAKEIKNPVRSPTPTLKEEKPRHQKKEE